jgi:hypothetical protein
MINGRGWAQQGKGKFPAPMSRVAAPMISSQQNEMMLVSFELLVSRGSGREAKRMQALIFGAVKCDASVVFAIRF